MIKTITHPIYHPICARAGRVCQNVARVTFEFFTAAIQIYHCKVAAHM
ncbi:MAG: hypothetical protein LBQ18_01320 [Campylobacteraceae bacterium]|nr:hypothetical protein [Campylobacteraceae bacterium]